MGNSCEGCSKILKKKDKNGTSYKKSMVDNVQGAPNRSQQRASKSTARKLRIKSVKSRQLERDFSKNSLQLFYNIEEQVSHEDVNKLYTLGKIIGNGHFGKVRLAYPLADPRKKFAMKSISKESLKKDFKLLEAELTILKEVDHPNIVKFYEVYSDKEYYHIVMELCTGGELLERVMKKGRLHESIVAPLLQKIISAVNHLHQIDICHRDLKPENFLFENQSLDSDIRLVDFGLSKKFGGKLNMTTIVGTPYYVAPEVLGGSYDKACDMWSIGVIAYVLLSGYPPFDGEDKNDVFKKIRACNYDFSPEEDWEGVSNDAKEFIRALITLDPKRRLTSEKALNHPWIQKYTQGIKAKPINLDVMQRLKNIKKLLQLQKESLHVLVNSLTSSEIQQAKETFEALDINSRGFLTSEELEIGFKKCGIAITEHEIDTIIANADFNFNCTIEYTEFLITTLDSDKLLTPEKLNYIFKRFDVQNKGLITVSSLQTIFQREGKKLSITNIEHILNESNEGRLEMNIASFTRMMRNIL